MICIKLYTVRLIVCVCVYARVFLNVCVRIFMGGRGNFKNILFIISYIIKLMDNMIYKMMVKI